MSNKLVDNKRRGHAEKVLQKLSQKASQPGGSSNTASTSSSKNKSIIQPLREQYDVIRKDIIKLRDDLNKGYEMTKEVVEKKGLISQLLKSR
jgi:uncharacterized protein involved in exopolysaccharide biosynthesis